jgi:hypothetical protein
MYDDTRTYKTQTFQIVFKEIGLEPIDLFELLVLVQRLLRANEKREKRRGGKTVEKKEAVFIAAKR